MLAVAYEHQDAGRRVYIVTAASHELAEMLARVLGFDGAIGSQLLRGRRRGLHRAPDGIVRLPQRQGGGDPDLAEREDIDLAASFAYSDSESDLPMLQVVGHAVAVNPDRELLAVARREGWGVLRFDRLGRRLKLSLALAGAAAAGGAGSARWWGGPAPGACATDRD